MPLFWAGVWALCLGVLCPVGTLEARQALRELLHQGERLENEMRSQEALALYLQADELYPNNTKVLVKIAKQYSDLVNDEPSHAKQKPLVEMALNYAKRAVAADPNDADANLVVAVSYCKLTPYIGARQKVAMCNEVKAYAERAVALDPRSDYAHHVLGRWHQEVSQVGAVERTLAKALFGGIPQADLRESLKQLDLARKLRPDRLIHQVEYGRTLIMMGRIEEGRREIQKGLAMPITEKDDPESKARGERSLAAL